MKKQWLIGMPHSEIDRIAQELGVSKTLAQLYVNRGLTNPESAKAFCNPSLSQLHKPELLYGCPHAAQRILESIIAKEKIVVYGDYDVDGLTGTFTLVQAIRMLGGICEYFIPHRMDDGYGLNVHSVNDIIDAGAKLIVTVDCGITGHEPAQVVHDRGVMLIISDHHEAKDWQALPVAHSIVHPMIGDSYPNHHLCGSGVAWKLSWALGQAANGSPTVERSYGLFLKHVLAFTALGTIADVMPLIGENRAIVAYGLKELRDPIFPGLKALLASAGIENTPTAMDVAFGIGPRINAAGRMGHAALALTMFFENDFAKALSIANTLEEQNKKRQDAEAMIVKDAEKQYEALKLAGQPDDVIVVRSGSYHGGVVGIAAARLAEKYHRPAIVLCGEKSYHGSGRSINGFHLTKALKTCEEYLISYGGHAMACGVNVKADCLEAFRAAICGQYNASPRDPAYIKIEGTCELGELSESFIQEVNKLAPFGQGNKSPLFYIKDLTIASCKPVGKDGKCLSLVLKQGNHSVKAIWFRPTKEAMAFTAGQAVHLVGEPSLNVWNGNWTVQILIKDLRLCNMEDIL